MIEVDHLNLTRGGEPSETMTDRSLIIEQEESLVEESMVKCFYVAPSSTFANLPDSISCSCAGAASTFKWSCLLPEALASLSSVLLTNCSTLQLDLRVPPATPPSSSPTSPSQLTDPPELKSPLLDKRKQKRT